MATLNCVKRVQVIVNKRDTSKVAWNIRYKLGQSAQRGFLRLNGSELIQEVMADTIDVDGVKKSAA